MSRTPQLSQAVDAGALAGARVLGSGNPASDARMYFDANLANGSSIDTVTSFSAVPDAGDDTLTVNASGTIPATFLRLAGSAGETIPISASATSRRTTFGMELALVLDVTGSMQGSSMAQLRLAALDLVGILFGSKAELDTLFVSVVPYVASVNFGYDRTAWLQSGSYDPASFHSFHWRGCVEARGDART